MKSPSQLRYPAPLVPSRGLHWLAFGFSAAFLVVTLVAYWPYAWLGWPVTIVVLLPSIVPFLVGMALRYRWLRKRREFERHEQLRHALLAKREAAS